MKIELTQYGKWLPADTQTPISLYLGLVGDAPGILLESAEVDGRLGRYSLIAWDFRLKLSPVRGKLSVECADSRLAGLATYSGMDFLEGMRAVMKALHLKAQPEVGELPALTRGLYGTLGYGIAGMLEPKLKTSCPLMKLRSVWLCPDGWFFSTISGIAAAFFPSIRTLLLNLHLLFSVPSASRPRLVIR